MKRLLSLMAVVACAQAVLAAQMPSFQSTDFRYTGVQALRQGADGLPPAAGAPADKLNKGYLFLQTGKENKLIGFADTQEQYQETVSFWKSILSSNGIELTDSSFENGIMKFTYKTKDGSVIRDFWAEPKQFKPKDEASLRENRDMVLGELAKTNKVIASFVSDLEYMLPTYKAYYLVQPNENPDHESQLRVLHRGEDIDFDVFDGLKDIRVVQKPETWMMVYIGPELGFVSRIAATREELDKKMKDRMDYLTGLGKVMIGTRVHPIDFDDYKFLGNIYFYQ